MSEALGQVVTARLQLSWGFQYVVQDMEMPGVFSQQTETVSP